MNFRHILSKSSLRSSTSSGKCLSHSEEVTKLHSEIESLKLTVESLKVSLESRDAAIGTLAREKEKLYVELKSAQRTNRNLHQQLVDERDIHSKEKEYYVEEIKRITKNEDHESYDRANECLDEEQSTPSMREELRAKDEVICNLCAKYLKIKSGKKRLQKKLEKLHHQNQKTCENIILLLQDNRHTLDTLLRKLLKTSAVSPDSKKYLKLLKINANLHYENTQLKVCLSQKDFSEDIDKGELHQECEQHEYFTPRRITKSEAKFKNPDIQLQHSKYSNSHGFEICKNFRNFHSTFSPYFRRKVYRPNSEPCLARL